MSPRGHNGGDSANLPYAPIRTQGLPVVVPAAPSRKGGGGGRRCVGGTHLGKGGGRMNPAHRQPSAGPEKGTMKEPALAGTYLKAEGRGSSPPSTRMQGAMGAELVMSEDCRRSPPCMIHTQSRLPRPACLAPNDEPVQRRPNRFEYMITRHKRARRRLHLTRPRPNMCTTLAASTSGPPCMPGSSSTQPPGGQPFTAKMWARHANGRGHRGPPAITPPLLIHAHIHTQRKANA